MFDALANLLETSFTGPVWPASVVLSVLVVYAVLSLIGLVDVDLEAPEFGGDGAEIGGSEASGDAEHLSGSLGSLGSIGAATVDWLNLSRVPLFIWVAVFGVVWWVISLAMWDGFDQNRYRPTFITSLLLAVRNGVVAVGFTKLATGPMAKWFERNHFYRLDNLIGGQCEISTSEVTPEFGRAKYKTDAAPLLLNVRTRGETLVKGQRATIIDFDPQKRIYTVQSSEAQQ